jgi:transcriptional regulator with XRE-family HTH domain
MVDIILRGSKEYITDLKGRLEKYKISQNALAREMQKNPTQVSRWFTDNPERRVVPELDTITAIEAAVERLRKRKARH